MTTSTGVLDAAFDRLGRWGFDDPDGFVNHGPMTCEALDVLGRPDEVDSWSRVDSGTPPAVPVEPRWSEWSEAVGDATRAGEWVGHFERAVEADGWQAVLGCWLPRLLPAMGVALFHGAIRSAHATRAIGTADTPARRAELARALGYWAALYEPGAPVELVRAGGDDDVAAAIAGAAADAARHYVARPNIFNLHGVTAAMAVSILVEHVDDATAVRSLAQVRAEHAVLHEGAAAPPLDPSAQVPSLSTAALVDGAVAAGDAHAVKLVEACGRGHASTGDPVFLLAAERVTRRGRRVLDRSSGAPAD